MARSSISFGRGYIWLSTSLSPISDDSLRPFTVVGVDPDFQFIQSTGSNAAIAPLQRFTQHTSLNAAFL